MISQANNYTNYNIGKGVCSMTMIWPQVIQIYKGKTTRSN